MTTLATLDDVKLHLRYDGEDHDEMLEIYLAAATRVVTGYITDEISDEMLPVLKVAVLLMTGFFDENRNTDSADTQHLPNSVRQLLNPYRKIVI